MKKDLNQIAAIEIAIKKKYGAEAIANPLGSWTPEKEKEYLEQLQDLACQEDDEAAEDEFEDLNGVLIHKKLVNRRKENHCDTCKSKIVNLDDDVSYTKFFPNGTPRLATIEVAFTQIIQVGNDIRYPVSSNFNVTPRVN